MTLSMADFGKLELILISSLTPMLKCNSPSEHLAVKLLCSSKGELFSNSIFLKNIKHFGTKIYKLCNMTCTHYMEI
jgi:hypothetical protein